MKALREAFSSALGRPWLAGAVLGALILVSWPRWMDSPLEDFWPDRLARGEAILHGLAIADEGGGLSWSMPLSSLAESLRHVHLPRPLRDESTRLIMAATLVALFCLGRLLGSCAGALLAVYLAVRWELVSFADAQEHVWYQLLVLMVALLLVRRARETATAWAAAGATAEGKAQGTDVAAGACLGLAAGASALVRSPIVLFPAVLAVYERFSAPKGARKGWRAPLLMALLPFLMLLPWTLMNWSVHKRFVPFEDHRALTLAIPAAMGLVMADGSFSGLVGAAGIEESQGTLAWAAAESLRHPLRYLGGYGARVLYFFRLHPFIILFAGLGLWLFRRREDHRQVGLLAAYLVGLHCALAVLPRYFAPVWPLLLALAVRPADLLLARLLPGWQPEGDAWSARAAQAAAWVFWVPVFGLALWALALSAAYPLRRSGSLESVERALEDHPEDAWLWSEAGRRRLSRGDAPGAVRDFARALSLDPRQDRRIDHAAALLSAGGRASDLIERMRLDDSWQASRGHILRMLSGLRRGRTESALSSLRQANRLRCGREPVRLETAREKEMAAALREGETDYAPQILSALDGWPERERKAMLERLRDPKGAGALLSGRDTAAFGGRLWEPRRR